jgi:hypothetical protein
LVVAVAASPVLGVSTGSISSKQYMDLFRSDRAVFNSFENDVPEF